MRQFFTNLRCLARDGFVFLLPVYVLFLIITKAWTSLSSVGTSIAAMFGMKSILGVGTSTAISGILLIGTWIVCGLLVRLSLVAAFNRTVEKWLSKYIPGYDTYKTIAEEKLHNKVKSLSYGSALVKQGEYWQPAYVVEHDDSGNYLLFLPNVPDTSSGHVLLAAEGQVRIVSSLTAHQLDSSLKNLGKGLLTEYAIHEK
jgi:hypothetical protein